MQQSKAASLVRIDLLPRADGILHLIMKVGFLLYHASQHVGLLVHQKQAQQQHFLSWLRARLQEGDVLVEPAAWQKELLWGRTFVNIALSSFRSIIVSWTSPYNWMLQKMIFLFSARDSAAN